MVKHLESKANGLLQKSAQSEDVVLDIGSNDGTTLGAYQRRDLTLLEWTLCG